ncbi:energy-coupling factor transporter transmembrane component T [Bifidobacterium sp. ESL0784]|nr:energy-coupling factor transporter transmembrane component T [Bifidobacterium sp. ESL0784]MDF7640516.1 energy-coupling factor transporter transmembrane component T [Bifidobacterium sp. ESL0784]
MKVTLWSKLLHSITSQFSTKSLVLIPIAVGINLIGGTLCSTLKLPLFMDMIGTMVIACLSGPWVAALCGLLTNVFLAIVANPVYLPYALSSVLCGLAVGYMVKAGLLKKLWGILLIWLACSAINTVTASMITVFVYGGATGVNGTSILTAALTVAWKNILISVFSSSMLENLIDKGITLVIVTIVVGKIPRRFMSQYASGNIKTTNFKPIKADAASHGYNLEFILADLCKGKSGNANPNTLPSDAEMDERLRKADSVHDAPGAMGRANPLVKFLGVFLMGLAALVWPDFTLGLVIVAGLFVLAWRVGCLRAFSKLMFGFGIPMAIMLMFIQGLYSPKNTIVIADFGFAQLGLQGVLYASKIVVTVLVFLGSFYIANKTTYIGSLVAALTQIGCPSKLGYLIFASLNVVPQMQRKTTVIRQAQSARGLTTGGSLVSRFKAFLPLIGPVVMSSLSDAQERGMTLETRGFGIKGVRRTNYVKVSWTSKDAVALWSLIAVFLVVLVLSILDHTGMFPVTYPWGGVR